MADRRTARPVSGEIMAGAPSAPRPGPTLLDRDDLVEADFEVLAPAGRPVAAIPSSLDTRTPFGDGMDMLRGADATSGRVPTQAPGGPIFWIAGLSAVLAAFWAAGGHSMVSAAFAPSSAGSAAALVISGVVSRVDMSGPNPLLFVDGHAGNRGGEVTVMSELEIRVTGTDGRVTRYKLGTSGRTMAPGETFAFSSRLDVPKNGVETVSVSFSE